MSEVSGDRATSSHRSESGEIDAQIRLAELEIKKAEAARIRAETGKSRVNWTISGPLLVAIVVALIGMAGNYLNGAQQIELETRKASTTLVVEAVKTGSQDPKVAQQNLEFFIRAGLLPDPRGNITQALKEGFRPVLAVTATPPPVESNIFGNWNTGGVTQSDGGPPQSATFTIFNDHFVSSIETYHWNGGRGKAGGQIALKLKDGAEIGRWVVVTGSGQNDAPNVNWACRPNIKISPGTYEVVDSDRASWSYNRESHGAGFSKVMGYPTLMVPPR